MKLRNKKTGEIWEFIAIQMDGTPKTNESARGVISCFADSIAELNEEWEDYEENEYYYAITSIKADDGITKMKNKHNDMTAFDKAIGNYFETKEEAKKAVEKLKAFKRLKDKGFKFTGIYEESSIDFIVNDLSSQTESDLKLLFGGEE